MVEPADRRLITEASLGVALDAEAALSRNADNLTSGTVADARIPSTIARDSEVTSAVAAEATLARNGDNITSGTVADARIASTIARDSEVAAEAALARDADNLTSGTVADARIASTIARDSEVAAGYQPLDSDLTTFSALGPANDDVLQRKAGLWSNRTLAQLLADLKDLAATLTNKTINLSNNTLSGTLAQFNTAVSDADLAPINNPIFTGNPQVPTASPGENDLTAASTAFVTAAIAAAVLEGSAFSYAALTTTSHLNIGISDWNKIALGTTEHVDSSFFTIGSGGDAYKIIITETGIYDIAGFAQVISGTSGNKGVSVTRNGITDLLASDFVTGTTSIHATPSSLNLPLTAGDELQLNVYSTVAGDDIGVARLMVRKVG